MSKFFLGMKGAQRGNKKGNMSCEQGLSYEKWLDLVLLVANAIIFLALIISLPIKSIAYFLSNFKNLDTIFMEVLQIALIIMTAMVSSFLVNKNQKPKKVFYLSRNIFLCNLIFIVIMLFSFNIIIIRSVKEHLTQIIITLILAITIAIICVVTLIRGILIKKKKKKLLKNLNGKGSNICLQELDKNQENEK